MSRRVQGWENFIERIVIDSNGVELGVIIDQYANKAGAVIFTIAGGYEITATEVVCLASPSALKTTVLYSFSAGARTWLALSL